MNYTHESYSAFTIPPPPPGGTLVAARSDSLAGLTLGDAFTHKIGKSTDITQSFFFYPGLTTTRIENADGTFKDVHGYRGTFNFGTVTKLNKWLGWQNSFGGYLCQQPAARNEKERPADWRPV